MMNALKSSLAVLLAILAFSCEKDPVEVAKKQLRKKGYEYSNGYWFKAITNGDVEAMKLFRTARMDPNVKNDKGNTAIVYAVNKGNAPMVKGLIEEGAQVAVQNSMGMSTLTDAASKGYLEVVKVIVEDMKKKNGGGPLLNVSEPVIWSCKQGKIEVLKYLAENGADMNASKNGESALMWAARNGHQAVVEFLLNQKVDVNKADKYNNTPTDWAKNEGYPKIVRLLKKSGGKNVTMK